MSGPSKVTIPASVQIGGALFFGALCALDAVANANPIPHVDATGIVEAAMAGLFLLSPYVARFRMSASSVDVDFGKDALKAATESTEDLEDAVEAIGAVSNLTQDWLSQVNWLNRHLQLSTTSDEEALRSVIRFCRERIADIQEVIGDPDEKTRLSVWWFSEKQGGLVFLLSDDIRDIETKSFVFHIGEGILGQAYAENRYWNLPDAPSAPGYVQIRKEPPKYRGLLCVPMQFGGHELVGMVSVDRELAQSFDESDVDLVNALADVLVYALTLPRVTQQFRVLPDRAIAALVAEYPQSVLPATSEDAAGET